MSIPTKEKCDLSNPEEKFLWALVHLPNVGGVATVTHPDILKAWSVHLGECGFVHVDELLELADADGNIRVSQLPVQEKKLQTPFRGPQHQYNGASKWVPMDTPDPVKVVIPDIRQMTPEENAAMIRQYQEAGMLPPPAPALDKAEVE